MSVMEHDLGNTISLLSNTPGALNALLRGLPAIWVTRNEGENTWCALEIVAHLIHGERTDWLQRARIIMDFGDRRQFEPFNREGFAAQIEGKRIEQLLEEFAQVRSENLDELRAWKLQPEDLQRRGRHPVLGEVTLSQLLATWVAHDLTHLHQISRVMAHQYRDAVGPWSAFLGVLQCHGHSSS